jgi:hypothetical protein
MVEAETNPTGWPQLNWPEWQATAETLHMWTQIVGKTRLALTPLQNHWWNVAFYVSARGLATSPMPLPDGRLFEVEFDFIEHVLHLVVSTGNRIDLPLRPQTVAAFFAEYKAALATLGVHAHIYPMPVEVATPIRFDLDQSHASYDREAVERFHRVLILAATLFKRFSTGFQGKISPVHFFWGSFDLCVTRFSGRPATGPPRPDAMQQEAYSHEVISAGFWPGNGGFGAAAFYCYAAPVPDGLAAKPISPGSFDTALGEFILRYDDARSSANLDRAVMDFLESSYAACADAAHWDRSALERPIARTLGRQA